MYAYRLLVYCHLIGLIDMTKYINTSDSDDAYCINHLGYNIYESPNQAGLAKNGTWYYITKWRLSDYECDELIKKIMTKLYITQNGYDLVVFQNYYDILPGELANLL